jgi:hypothetical protein
MDPPSKCKKWLEREKQEFWGQLVSAGVMLAKWGIRINADPRGFGLFAGPC